MGCTLTCIKEKRGRILWTLLIQLINYKPLHKTNHKRRILPLRYFTVFKNGAKILNT